MNIKTKLLLIGLALLFSFVVYAGSYYRVLLGVTPGCQTGSTMEPSVWAEGEFAACDIAKSHPFDYCCRVIKQ